MFSTVFEEEEKNRINDASNDLNRPPLIGVCDKCAVWKAHVCEKKL